MKNNITPAKTLSTYKFAEYFPDEAAATAYIEKVIWNDIPICPRCGSANSYLIPKIRGHRCSDCLKNYTVRHGTIFSHSRLPLRQWLYAMCLLLTSRKGISSLQLSKELDVTQRTSWFILHRLRNACDLSAIRLSGIVEADEAYIGGTEPNKHEHKRLKAGRGPVGKTIVAGARERGGKVVMGVVRNTSGPSLRGFVTDNVEPGSMLMTDECPGYNGLSNCYDHSRVNHTAKEYVNGMAHTNSIESVWAVLKRGYNGVYHNWSPKHMQKYINEFAFRLNEGNCKVDTIDRMSAMIAGSVGKRLAYKDLTDD